MLITVRLHEVFHSNWLDLHDVADVQIQDPFILVQEPENSSHVDEIGIFLVHWSFGIVVYLKFSIFNVDLFITFSKGLFIFLSKEICLQLFFLSLKVFYNWVFVGWSNMECLLASLTIDTRKSST